MAHETRAFALVAQPFTCSVGLVQAVPSRWKQVKRSMGRRTRLRIRSVASAVRKVAVGRPCQSGADVHRGVSPGPFGGRGVRVASSFRFSTACGTKNFHCQKKISAEKPLISTVDRYKFTGSEDLVVITADGVPDLTP